MLSGADTELIFMKKLLLTIATLGSMASAYAQNFKEPEYIGQVGVMNADSTVTLLPTEKTEMKAKTNGLIYIPVAGSFLGKGQSFLIVKGATSQTTVPSSNLQLVVRVDNNGVVPSKKIGFVKFEVKKKERRYLMAEAGMFTGTTAKTSYDGLKFKATKIGNSSYLVTFDDVKPGEYALVTEDLSEVATFSVK